MEIRRGARTPTAEELRRVAEEGADSLGLLGAVWLLLEQIRLQPFSGDSFKLQAQLGNIGASLVYGVLGLVREQHWAHVIDDPPPEIDWNGTVFRVGKKTWDFTEHQAPYVQILYDAWRACLPTVRSADFVEKHHLPTAPNQALKRNPAWKTLIIQGDKPKTLKLDLPLPTSS
ncbi:MAG: hypothetical protein ACYTF6_15210 [Planctomycetota bacterium]|jgi:hypothetical protein